MSEFGFKIVEKRRCEIDPLVQRALSEGRPIEVGLYFGDPSALTLLLERLPGSGVPVAVHLDHRRLSLFGVERREEALSEQLRLAVRLGARYVITHVSPYPMTPRLERRKAMLEHLFASLRFAVERCAVHGLELHVENTFHDLAFYRRLFSGVLAGGLEGVNVCFDIGHAKVWSTDSLGQWLSFLTSLQDEGMRLHFHLHANRGLSDEHLSFVSAEQLGITRPDGYTGGMDYFQALMEIAERFPGASKVFEVPADEAEENLDLVLDRLAALRAARPAASA